MMRKLIRCDGTEREFSEPVRWSEISRLIGAEHCDVVALRHMGAPLHVMYVNDRGYETETVEHEATTDSPFRIELRPVRALLPVNPKATALYLLNCIPGSKHLIVGDVFVCPDDDHE